MKNNKIIKPADYLNAIINIVDDGIFVKDDSHCFVLVNDAFCNLLGKKREEIIGKTLGESLPKDQMAHFLKIDKMVLRFGKESLIEEVLTGRNGKIHNILTKKIRYIDNSGKKFIVGSIHDISEIKTSEKILNEKILELEEINSLLVGRELKMIEQKEEINRLKKHSDNSLKKSIFKYMDGINLEENMIKALEFYYKGMIIDSNISDINKTKILGQLSTLKADSEGHEKKLRNLDERN